MTAVEKLIYDVDFFGFYDEKYTLKKQIYSWRELRYTCHALGLPANSFDKAVRDNDIPEYIRARVSDYGIEYIGVRDLIDARYLDDHFSEATNLHSVEYQCDCVREALKLLENKQISFSMLHAARLLFYFYEDPTDIHGLKYDMTLLRKMLKYLGLILHTKRLDQLFRVMLMEASTKNQLQLFEFIQLNPKCQSIDPELERERQIARKETSTDRKMARSRNGSRIETRGGSYHQVGGSHDNRELPKDMRDFDRILTTPETRAQIQERVHRRSGILQQKTILETSQQNGTDGRCNRTLLDIAKSHQLRTSIDDTVFTKKRDRDVKKLEPKTLERKFADYTERKLRRPGVRT
ncbi:uncharacterized protein LOC142340650 [Convolutriloba macropyga]|uniref:uncharacterized protein LOC142340650 n=1 Tax=Convolutriloba macropyga TaxID=536237 RepID=UPI003F526971